MTEIKEEQLQLPIVPTVNTTLDAYLYTAAIVQELKVTMRTTPNWKHLSHVQRESLEMIQLNIGCLLSGNPTDLSHVNTILGYAELLHKATVSDDV